MATMTAYEVTKLETDVKQVKSEIALAQSKYQAGNYDAAKGRAMQAHSLFYAFASKLPAADANALEAKITAIITAANRAASAPDINWFTTACSWTMDKLDVAYEKAIGPSLQVLTQPLRDAIAKYDEEMDILDGVIYDGQSMLKMAASAATDAVRSSIRTRATKQINEAMALQREIRGRSVSFAGLSTGSMSMWIETIRAGLKARNLGAEPMSTTTMVVLIGVGAGMVLGGMLTGYYLSVRSKEADNVANQTAAARETQAEQKGVNDLKIAKQAQLSALKVKRAQMVAAGATAAQLAVIDAQIAALEAELGALDKIKPYEPPGGWFPNKPKVAEKPWYESLAENMGYVLIIGVGAIITVKYILPAVKAKMDERKNLKAG